MIEDSFYIESYGCTSNLGDSYIITKMLEDIEIWMANKMYEKLEDFRGNLSKKNIDDPFAYRRAQYVDILMRSGEIFKKYPMK